MITRQQLRTDLPPVIERNGYTNNVLALRGPCSYTKDNTYSGPWDVVNAIWYRDRKKYYLGWIELEDIQPEEL